MKRKDKTEIHKLSIPVYQKEERVIRRVLSEIGSIGDPQFSVEENKFKTNLEWEDYEEPKTHWMIDTSVLEPVREIAGNPYEIDKEIGNWFSTKEEAEKAAEKLKAWKRLKDKGFRFYDWKDEPTYRVTFEWSEDIKVQEVQDDLNLLFGGEE